MIVFRDEEQPWMTGEFAGMTGDQMMTLLR